MENNVAIQYQTTPYSEAEILDSLHPFVREWFQSKFEHFSPPQRFSIRNIQLGINSLISSPTGSGKTLSAFLAVINELVTRADTGGLADSVYCIYLSPLKALANDINRNLTEPLREISAIAEKYQRTLPIRVGTRTGDTTQSERTKMRELPPHILITTPESLAIALTSIRFSQSLKETRYVIIDEIHALAENKRGTHMALTIERLAKHATFTRIGLSATVAPLEEVAKFLVGYDDPDTLTLRPCNIIDVEAIIRTGTGEFDDARKQLDLQVLSPVSSMIDTSHHKLQQSMYDLIHRLVQEHRTTLIFTNTRSGTERVVHQLKARFPTFYSNVLDADEEQEQVADREGNQHERLAEEAGLDEEAGPDEEEGPEEENAAAREKTAEQAEQPIVPGTQDIRSLIGAHHGSLSREHRLRIESMLKRGELRCVVCSTSLELGIDIGYIDLVILLGSPKSVARALQRIGRSGHKLHEVAKGRLIVMDRDDLVECSVLLKTALDRKIDRIAMPKAALDVLAQHLYGMAIEDVTPIEEAWRSVRSAYPYGKLARKDFESTLQYLAGAYGELAERNIYGKIWIDKEQGTFGKKGKLARLIYMTNVGTIPDETAVKVKIGEHTIGTITEDFMERLKPGDVFVLGGEAYEFKFSRGMTAQVKTSEGRLPTVPNWISESLPLNYDLATEIQRFRRYVWQLLEDRKPKEEIKQWLRGYLRADEQAIAAIADYFTEQHRFSVVPHERRMLIEHFRDGNKKYVFVHSLYGRRTNDVLARALAYVNGKLTGRDVEIGITDNGFYLKSTQPIQAIRAIKLIRPEELQRLMEVALEKSEVLKRRFRHCATRGLMILRQYKGERKSVGKQQVSSQLIINAVRRIPGFPILKEAHREILEDLMDIHHAREVIGHIQSGHIELAERTTDVPSPFAFNMVLQGYVDLLKMEDRVEFVRRLHEMVVAEIEGKKPPKENILPAVEFTYERLWDQQEAQERLKQEDLQAYLKEQLRQAAFKIGLDADIYYHAQRLIDGETTGYPEKFKEWLRTLLSGTVPKVWKDDLVKLFIEKEKLL